MAEHVAVFEAQSNRWNGTLGLPLSMVTTLDASGVSVSGGNDDFNTDGALPVPLIHPSGYGPTNSAAAPPDIYTACTKAIGMVQNGGVAPPIPAGAHAGVFTQLSRTGEYFWNVNGVAATNGATSTIEPVGNSALAGRVTRDQRLRWTSDAGVALAAAAADPVLFHGHLEYRYPVANPYQGLIHFLEFADIPPDAAPEDSYLPNLPNRLNALLQQLTLQSGSRYLLGNAGGVDLYAEECGYAAVAPEGAVYIRPEDFGGAAADRIPIDYQQNEAARFRFHPSVFIRRPQYIRGLMAGYADWYPIDALDTFDSQVMRIITVTSDPGASNWLIVIDGQAQVVRLLHPAGSDLRRPRDIWNEVWTPLIQGSNAISRAVELQLIQPPSGFGGGTNVQIVTARLRFLEYARCLPLPGNRQDQGQPN